MNKTTIEWVKNPDGTQGYTWNPITGCLNGCEYCYARKLAWGRLCLRYIQNGNVAVSDVNSEEYADAMTNPFYPRFWEDRMDDPFLTDRNICIKRHTRGQRRTPRGIFVCDMGELFGDWLPREWQEQIHLLITCNPQHRFYLLTKQPQNLIKFMGGSPANPYRKADKLPSNCWAGVTITSKDDAPKARDFLLERMAVVNFLSIEPFLRKMDGWALANVIRFADWVIIGALTGKKYELLELCQKWNIEGINQGTRLMQYRGNLWTLQPKIEWVEEIVRACDRAGIPVFLKDNLEPILPQGEPFYRARYWHTGGGWELRRELPDA